MGANTFLLILQPTVVGLNYKFQTVSGAIYENQINPLKDKIRKEFSQHASWGSGKLEIVPPTSAHIAKDFQGCTYMAHEVQLHIAVFSCKWGWCGWLSDSVHSNEQL